MPKSKSVIIFSMLFAFFVWGGWAYYVNVQQGDATAALKAALTQSFYSTVMTLYMSLSVLFVHRKSAQWKWPRIWPTLATVGHTSLALIGVHYLNHTPALLKTVSLPILVSLVYCAAITPTSRASNP